MPQGPFADVLIEELRNPLRDIFDSPGKTLTQQVAALLASFNGPKLWQEPSDISTLSQDAAGTTPVVAAGDPIGRIADKSGAGNHATQPVGASKPLWQTTFAAFDGVDDSWLTPGNVDFTTTDEVTVIAGVRKLSDAADGMIFELSSSNSNNGMFYLKAPGSGMVTKYEFLTRGTAQAIPFTTSATYNAPSSVVATGSSKIATPVATLRLNGVQVDQKVVTQGTGNYGTYPLFFGRRNNGSIPFTGNLYGLIIIGRLLTAAEQSLLERYMAQKVGVTL